MGRDEQDGCSLYGIRCPFVKTVYANIAKKQSWAQVMLSNRSSGRQISNSAGQI